MKIRLKVGLPTAGIAVVLSGLCLWFVHDQLQSLEEDVIQDNLDGRVAQVLTSITQASDSALSQAALFSLEEDVIAAYEIAHQGDLADENDPYLQQAREALRAKLGDTMKGHKLNVGSDFKIHFHLPSVRSLARMWRPKQAKRNGEWVDISDDLSAFRNTVADVNTSKVPIKGIEPGRGGFTIRGLAPISNEGKHLGSVEVLLPFTEIMRPLEEDEKLKALLFMDAKLLPITTQTPRRRQIPSPL